MADVYDPIETRPWGEVLADHGRLLPEQIEYLAENSDFYRRRFDEWGIDPEDVERIHTRGYGVGIKTGPEQARVDAANVVALTVGR